MKIFCLALFIIFTFHVISKGEIGVDSFQRHKKRIMEDSLIDKLFQLTEVKQLDKELKRKIGVKTNVSIMIVSTPTEENPYFEINVGYNGPYRFETRYDFRIKKANANRTNFQQYIELWNWNSQYIPLLEWRKNNHRQIE